MERRRIFLIVLDSVGIGLAKDAKDFNDLGSNTLKTIKPHLKVPNLQKLGLFNIDLVSTEKNDDVIGSYARLCEASKGKDTTIGHWEIAGIISNNPLPTYKDGFPKEIIDEFTKKTGKNILCNKPYSGTEVIEKYGKEHMETGDLIVYTSADSVFQIAAHEQIVPIEDLYKYCEIAREILNKYNVGRVIARPFEGEYPNFKRTSNRHDYSLVPPRDTLLDTLCDNNYDTIGIGKIYDIFAGKGVKTTYKTKNNQDGMDKTIDMLKVDFNGLCFVNLVDFDMVFGHRNDVLGYANALNEFDIRLKEFMDSMKQDDMLIITADHGCDPSFAGTDHTRENVPLIIYGNKIKQGVNLGQRQSFADISATILDIFGIKNNTDGISFKNEILVKYEK